MMNNWTVLGLAFHQNTVKTTTSSWLLLPLYTTRRRKKKPLYGGKGGNTHTLSNNILQIKEKKNSSRTLMVVSNPIVLQQGTEGHEHNANISVMGKNRLFHLQREDRGLYASPTTK